MIVLYRPWQDQGLGPIAWRRSLLRMAASLVPFKDAGEVDLLSYVGTLGNSPKDYCKVGRVGGSS